MPGTKDGQPTPGFNSSMLSLDHDGKYAVWDSQSGQMRTDPLQGECFHISKTKDAVSGGRWKRFDEMFATVPMTSVLHMDAYRDIDVSWETDEAGFIAEDEEAACGLAGDLRWLSERNLSLGVEGANGMASVGGPNTPAMNVFDYYWHGHWRLGEWGRIISGNPPCFWGVRHAFGGKKFSRPCHLSNSQTYSEQVAIRDSTLICRGRTAATTSAR